MLNKIIKIKIVLKLQNNFNRIDLKLKQLLEIQII